MSIYSIAEAAVGSPLDVDSNTGLRLTVSQAGPIPLDAKLTCGNGETLVLVGPSGSGKTTLLRSIAGLYTPQFGRIRCGNDVWLDTDTGINRPPQTRRVGMVFQDFALFPHRRVLNNVLLAMENPAINASERQAKEILARVNLQGLENRYPAELSGGQRQRVALARALARKPSVLLLDEPFSSVDQVTRRKLRFEMKRITQHLNIPIILVTHDLDEACMMADRMSVIHSGRTLQTGCAEEVLSKPVSATVARLIDIRNCFEAQIVEHGSNPGRVALRWEEYTLEIDSVPDYPVGSKVCWCIPPKGVLLHSRVRPSKGERENPVHGVITEMVTINGISHLIVELLPSLKQKIYMELPLHVVERNSLKTGEQIGLSLLEKAVHLMPWRPLSSQQQ